MSTLSRFGPVVARSILAQQHRNMASASVATDPIQKLFVDKIREMKSSNKGLDAAHEKQLKEEMLRLKRVYSVEDENKLTQLEHKFDPECQVSLRDIDTSKELRHKIMSGEYQKQLAAQPKPQSALLASAPDQTQHEMTLPPMNKPDPQFLMDNCGLPKPVELGEMSPDYEIPLGQKVTLLSLEREFNVHFGEKMPTIHDDDPQRDKVNFPIHPQPLETPPTRHHIIPESWFQFFYPKTGITGPYLFAGCFSSFLLSKEWLVMEHELLTGLSSTIIFTYAITKYGPSIKKWYLESVKEEEKSWDSWQQGNAKLLAETIDHYKKETGVKDVIDEVYAARKHDVEMQVEAEYRGRLKSIYDDTKRRLNYLVAVADSQRQIHHANLVNMVISNVMSSIGPKHEQEVLDDCIINLKGLASKHANAI